MYAQQTPPMPYVVPMPVPQGDSIDQLGKVVDLVDKLRSNSSPQPGSSQFSPYNIGQFQSANPQQLAAQELLLRNPQLLSQQSQLKHGFDTVVSVANQTNKHLFDLWEFTTSLMYYINARESYVSELERFAALGIQSQKVANALYNELCATQDVATIGHSYAIIANALAREVDAWKDFSYVQHAMLNTPSYMAMSGFNQFANTIGPGDDDALDLISSLYMSMVQAVENKKLRAYGRYSPQYQSYLQDEVVQHQQTQTNPNAVAQGINFFQEGLRTPGFGQWIKRAHTQRLINR